MSIFTDQDPLRALQWKFTHIPGGLSVFQLQLWSPNPTSNPADPFIRVCRGQGCVNPFIFLVCSQELWQNPLRHKRTPVRACPLSNLTEQLLNLNIFFPICTSPEGTGFPVPITDIWGGDTSHLWAVSWRESTLILSQCSHTAPKEQRKHLEVVTWGCQQQDLHQNELPPPCQAPDVFDKPKISAGSSKNNSAAPLTKGQ